MFAAVFAAPLAWLGTAKAEKLPTGAEILKSFDARDWARHFVAHVKANPSIATDEETMATWFANSLMRGYDEHANKNQSKPRPTIAELEEILAKENHPLMQILPNGEIRMAVSPIQGTV